MDLRVLSLHHPSRLVLFTLILMCSPCLSSHRLKKSDPFPAAAPEQRVRWDVKGVLSLLPTYWPQEVTSHCYHPLISNGYWAHCCPSTCNKGGPDEQSSQGSGVTALNILYSSHMYSLVQEFLSILRPYRVYNFYFFF